MCLLTSFYYFMYFYLSIKTNSDAIVMAKGFTGLLFCVSYVKPPYTELPEIHIYIIHIHLCISHLHLSKVT